MNLLTSTTISPSQARGRFVLFQAFSGTVYAAMQFGEVIARKSLNANAFEVTILTMMMPLAGLTSIWWGE